MTIITLQLRKHHHREIHLSTAVVKFNLQPCSGKLDKFCHMSTSVSRESLRLYRDILRASRHFTWTNPQGQPWSRILKEGARKEFEQASVERDPVILARLLVVGRESLQKTMEKFKDKEKVLENHINRTRND